MSSSHLYGLLWMYSIIFKYSTQVNNWKWMQYQFGRSVRDIHCRTCCCGELESLLQLSYSNVAGFKGRVPAHFRVWANDMVWKSSTSWVEWYRWSCILPQITPTPEIGSVRVLSSERTRALCRTTSSAHWTCWRSQILVREAVGARVGIDFGAGTVPAFIKNLVQLWKIVESLRPF